MGLGKRIKRKHYASHPCWRCGKDTTRYALCDYCHRNPPQREQQGWGDCQQFVRILHKYEKAAQDRLKANIKRWSCKDYSQEELQAILES